MFLSDSQKVMIHLKCGQILMKQTVKVRSGLTSSAGSWRQAQQGHGTSVGEGPLTDLGRPGLGDL